ncbi:MAG: hypothetical protein ABI534_05540 [Chloroflexota bacterium]
MFKKALIPAVAAALLTAALALPVGAAGPKCVDIQSANSVGTLSRASFDGQTVAGQFFLADRSCAQFSYTLVILDNEGDSTPLATGTVRGDGSAALIEIVVSGITVTDGDVCVYVESTTANGSKVFDRAPGDGCVVLLDDGSSPAGGKGF